jgi:hypothetical protein
LEKKAEPTRMFLGLLLISIGLVIFMAGSLIAMTEIVYYIMLEFSIMLVGLGLVRIALTIHFMEKLRKLEEDRRAIGWQLAVFFATIPACIFAWFVAAWPTDMVWQAVTGIVTFTGPEANAVNLTRQIVALAVGVAIFFSIIWLWVNAHRSGETV